MSSVDARDNKIAALGLALLLTTGAVCFSLSSPGTAIASTTSGCAQNMLAEGTPVCAEPMFMCNLGPSVHIVPKGLTGTQTSDSVKEFQVMIAGFIHPGSPDTTAFLPGQANTDTVSRFAQGIPVHLLNSVLSL